MTDQNGQSLVSSSNLEESIPAPVHVEPPQNEEIKAQHQEYLQKCCESGQLRDQLTQLESQRLQIEKNLEVTERAIKTARNKHKELYDKFLAKTKEASN